MDKENNKDFKKFISFNSFFFNRKIKFNEIDIEIMKNIILKAKKDLKASILLFNDESFSSSVFHLQQCCEKIVKVYAVLFGSVKSNNIKSIGHISPRAFYVMAKDLNLKNLNEILLNKKDKINGFKLKEFSKTLQKIKCGKLKEEEKKIAKISYEEINQVLLPLENCRKDLIKKLENKTIGELLKEKPKLEKFSNYFKLKKELDKIKNIPFKKYIKISYVSDTMIDYYIMLYLSIITFVHAIPSRYEDENIILEEEYNKDLGIVKASRNIQRILNEVLKRIELVLNKSPMQN